MHVADALRSWKDAYCLNHNNTYVLGKHFSLPRRIVFLAYTQIENHVLNPVIMSRTVRINPLLVLVAILVAASIGSWIGGFFGGFVAALLAIPAAGAAQVVMTELWRDTAPGGMLALPAGPGSGEAGAGTGGAGAGAEPPGAEPPGAEPPGTEPSGAEPPGTAPAGAGKPAT